MTSIFCWIKITLTYFTYPHNQASILEWKAQKGQTCSAAVGSLSNIACAARLFLTVIAAANGVAPSLSLTVRFNAGWERRSEMIAWCWFSIAMCNGIFPSTSWAHKQVSRRHSIRGQSSTRRVCYYKYYSHKWHHHYHSSRSGGGSGWRVCLPWLPCSFINSKLTWYLTSQCHHLCGYAKSRRTDLEVRNHHSNQAKVV